MIRLFPINRFRRGFFAVGFCLALGACDSPWLEDAPSLGTVLSKDWLFGDRAAAAARNRVQPIYCYETLGERDCYDRPLEGGANRLVGFDGPAPATDPLPAKP